MYCEGSVFFKLHADVVYMEQIKEKKLHIKLGLYLCRILFIVGYGFQDNLASNLETGGM